MKIFLIILGLFLFLFLFPTLIISYVIYSIVLVRTSKDKWQRGCSEPENEEQQRLYNEGMLWGENNKQFAACVTVKNKRTRLFGEYFDFGSRKAVIIIPGRTECLTYSYFYAEAYQKAGYNVLVIDNRCHGLSGGRFCSLGYREYKDIIKWCELLHNRFANESIVLHGICIGSSTALFTATSKKCPDYVSFMVADGMYKNFYETFRNHMKEQNRPSFPFLYGVMLHIRVFSGANVITDGPYKKIKKLKKPILFLHGEKDIYSEPKYIKEIYASCASPKKLVWFENGTHSRLRLFCPEKYDSEIKDFSEAYEKNLYTEV